MGVNSQHFTKKQIKEGQMRKLLDFLLSEAYGAGDYYNDIHIKPSGCGGDFTVEWVQVPWDNSYGGSFQHVDEDQIVMLEKRFPDSHYEYCFDEEDYKERLQQWLKENPGWVQIDCGVWTNEIVNAKLRETLIEKK